MVEGIEKERVVCPHLHVTSALLATAEMEGALLWGFTHGGSIAGGKESIQEVIKKQIIP